MADGILIIDAVDYLRHLAQDRSTDSEPAAKLEACADLIEDLDEERDNLSTRLANTEARLQAIEVQLQVLGTAAKYIQFAALDLAEPVPVLEVRR
ncbi:MAG: hypothetical protein ACH37Z_14945 [Anaerolineae bacterium]